MERVLLTKDLHARGFDGDEIEAKVRAGELVRVRRGAYAVGPEPPSSTDDRAVHRRLIAATIGQCHDGAVLSHMSAALLHGLPVWRDQLSCVQVIRNREGGGRSRRYVVVRGLPLADEDVVVVDGVATTSLARTVVDLACQLPVRRAVAIGDAALRQTLIAEPERDLRGEIEATLMRAVRRPGVPAARRAIGFLDPRSESAGESESRLLISEHGFPTPVLQYKIFDARGNLVARSDFGWPELRTVGEFDGAVKYSGRFGKSAEQAVLDEKRRENAIRAQGLYVARWVWSDLRPPYEFAAILRRTLSQARAG